MTAMTNEEIVRLFRLVEEEVPVERWVVDDVHVWPLFRAQVSIDNFFMFRRSATQKATSGAFAPQLLSRIPLGPLPKTVKNAVAYAKARLRDRAANDRLHDVDALLYSDGVSFLRLEGKYFDRFCDPIRERLEARGLASMMLTPLGRFQQPRHAPSMFVQPRLDLAQVRSAIVGRVRKPRQVELPGWGDALRIVREAFPQAAIRDETYLWRGAGYVRSYEAVHERFLDRTRPRIVFLVSYYGNEAMALIRACRRRGIVTVDLQHGCINDAHWAYAHWSRVPPGGYELMPRYFWVWSQAEARTIRSWSDRTDGAHAPIVGGNLFLMGWRDGTSPLIGPMDARVRAILQNCPPGLKHVMYTTNGFETDVELGVLRDAIARSKGRLFWWVRLHPVAPQSREAIERALAPVEGSFRIDAGELPLYASLRHMAAHVTEASSSVIEAAELGVPTVLLAQRESNMYQDLIDRGWAVVLGEGEDLAEAVLGCIGKTGLSEGPPRWPDPIDVVLRSAGLGG